MKVVKNKNHLKFLTTQIGYYDKVIVQDPDLRNLHLSSFSMKMKNVALLDS